MADVGIVVMVEESRRADLDQLATTLKNKGLHVQNKLPRFRAIVGTGDSSLLKELMSMGGSSRFGQKESFSFLQ